MTALGGGPERREPTAIRSFFLDQASHRGNGTLEKLTISLRAFLRYLAVKGRCQEGLAGIVPSYAHWRLADLPRYLTAEQVNRLITTCDGEVVARRRDRAIALLLARLGLRAGDVAQLRLDDIEWETGSLRVAGKSRYEVRLPLPQDVGDAIVPYLASRTSRAPRLAGAEVIDWRQLMPNVFSPHMTHKSADRSQPGVALRDRRSERHPIDRLIEAALRLRPKDGLRSRSYATLIALLAVTGLRVSEALKEPLNKSVSTRPRDDL
jgi:integrase